MLAENIMLILAIVFIILGLAALLGRFDPGKERMRRLSYGYLPVGLLFLVAHFEEQILQFLGVGQWLIYVAYALLIVWTVFWFWRPPVHRSPRR